MSTKICKKCGIEKPASSEYFDKESRVKDGLRSHCKECRKIENKIYRDNNKEQLRKRRDEKKEYYQDYHRKYYEDNKEKIKAKTKEYRIQNKDYYKRYGKRWIKEFRDTPKGKAISTMRNRFRRATKGVSSVETTKELLGCDFETFKRHMENQFTDGMSWDNHGLDGWHIDHIKPIASFDMSKEEDRKECFHYTNLQPLWCTDNWSKHDKNMDKWLKESR